MLQNAGDHGGCACAETKSTKRTSLSGLGAAALPIEIPVLLISGRTLLIPLPGGISAVAHGLMVLDDPDRTLVLAGIAFTVLYIRMWHPGREDVYIWLSSLASGCARVP